MKTTFAAAVAENQPSHQNRMNEATTFTGYSTRLREFIGQYSNSETACAGGLSRGSADGFSRLALELFRLQFTGNAPYQKLCLARRATPETVSSWKEIPAVPTAAFKELELTDLPPAERSTVFHSSGTTGQRPSRHFHNADSLALYKASLLPWFQAHLLADRGKRPARPAFFCFSPPPSQAPHSSLVHMFERVRRKFGGEGSRFLGLTDSAGSWSLDVEETCATLEAAAQARRPVLLLGTAFSFVHLLDAMKERNLRFSLPADSRVMETGGYKGRSRSLPKAELHALITERLGIPATWIVCEYGMSELSSQAYDCVFGSSSTSHQAPRLFRFPPWARFQVSSPETGREVAGGETGLLRVFDLANVRSVMAIQTEDLAVRHGDGFELVGRAAHAELRGCSLMAV
jgi:hypothetical protein